MHRYAISPKVSMVCSFEFDWEDISKGQDRIWPNFQTPQSLSKCAASGTKVF